MGGDGSVEQALPGVFDREAEVRDPVAGLLVDFGAEEIEGALGFEFDDEVEDAGGFAAADGEHAMRGDLFDRLAVVVIHGEFLLVVGSVGDFFADDDAFVEHGAAEELADVGTFADGFGDDVAGSFESFFCGGYAFFGVDESGGEGLERCGIWLLDPEVCGEGFETFLAGDHGFGAAFGLVGEREIFELALFEGFLDAGFQVVGEFALFGDGGDDCFFAGYVSSRK